MANKLAGQRMKFSKARATYYTTAEDTERRRAVQLMADVLSQAPALGFTEEQVTQGEDVPDEVRHYVTSETTPPDPTEAEEAEAEAATGLHEAVDTSDLQELGEGREAVYAYGYRCAPDRLKIGRCSADVVSRVAAQIGTSTPDKPAVFLIIRTHDCVALERVLHGVFRYRGKQVQGAGAEWFLVTRDEVIREYRKVTEPEDDR